MRLPVAFLTKGVFIVTHAGFKLRINQCYKSARLSNTPWHQFPFYTTAPVNATKSLSSVILRLIFLKSHSIEKISFIGSTLGHKLAANCSAFLCKPFIIYRQTTYIDLQDNNTGSIVIHKKIKAARRGERFTVLCCKLF